MVWRCIWLKRHYIIKKILKNWKPFNDQKIYDKGALKILSNIKEEVFLRKQLRLLFIN